MAPMMECTKVKWKGLRLVEKSENLSALSKVYSWVAMMDQKWVAVKVAVKGLKMADMMA